MSDCYRPPKKRDTQKVDHCTSKTKTPKNHDDINHKQAHRPKLYDYKFKATE